MSVRKDWRYLPWDDVGYFSSEEFLTWSDDQVRYFIRHFENTRYRRGWRNFNNLWRSTLGLDTTHGKRILDFGCGFGIEALQFCRSGNSVTLSDIYPSNVSAAKRVLELSGFHASEDSEFDVFYSNGVLHHTPAIRKILEEYARKLSATGEVRLLVYSDRAWLLTTGEQPPAIDDDVRKHPAFDKYVAAMDSSGVYADWYNLEKLKRVTDGLFDVYQFNYITQDGRYATAILRPSKRAVMA